MKDPRTPGQINQRVKFPNIVAMYRSFHGLLADCFQLRKRSSPRRAVTNFNCFVGANLSSRPVFLTRSESAAGYCIAAPYRVSEGELDAIVTQGVGARTRTDIALGDFDWSDTATVARFARAVVENNPDYEYGDTLAYLSVLQKVSAATGVPYVTTELYKVALDAADETPLRRVAPAAGFGNAGGFLGHGEDIGQGAFAWIHFRPSPEGVQVSTQRLVVNNDLFLRYGSGEARQASARSYGVKAVPVAPGVPDGRQRSAVAAGDGCPSLSLIRR